MRIKEMVERKEGREAGLSHSEGREGQMLWDGPRP